MMKKVVVSLLALVMFVTFFLISPVAADSPATSTPFSNAYLDIEVVEKARLANGMINEEICRLLASPDYSLEVKAAVINSLYHHSNIWGLRHNAEIYTEYLYRLSPDKIDLKALSPEELLVTGYLVLLDDYFQPEKALPFLTLAKEHAPDNYTVAVIELLARTQKEMLQSESWSSLWLLTKEAVGNPGLQEDRLRDEAVIIILDYLYLYRDPQDDIVVLFDGIYHIGETEPLIVEGRTLLPWRELFDALGAEAEWDEGKKQLVAQKGDTTMVLKLEQKHVEVNGEVKTTDRPPVMINGELMVPLRFISEALGDNVYWDEEGRTVKVVMAKPER